MQQKINYLILIVLLKIYKLREKLTFHEDQDGYNIILTPVCILNEVDESVNLDLVNRFKTLYLKMRILFDFSDHNISVSKEILHMTKAQIISAQQCWNNHCQIALEAYDWILSLDWNKKYRRKNAFCGIFFIHLSHFPQELYLWFRFVFERNRLFFLWNPDRYQPYWMDWGD